MQKLSTEIDSTKNAASFNFMIPQTQEQKPMFTAPDSSKPFSFANQTTQPKEEKKAEEPMFKLNNSAPVQFGGKTIEATPTE